MATTSELFEDPAVAVGVLRAVLRDQGTTAVARSLIRDLTVQGQLNGAAPPAWAEPVLRALSTNGLASETPVATVVEVGASGFVSVAECSEASELSEQYVRRLAGSGKIRAQRVGRDWRIDLDSLMRVTRRDR